MESKCEVSKSILESKLDPSILFSEIKYFYHVTKSKCEKQSIQGDCRLIANKAKLRFESEGTPIDGNLNGVFFCCSLFQGCLPDISPHGTERIKIPIGDFLHDNTRLFYNSSHTTNTSSDNVNYAVLVLVKEDHPDFQFCKDKLAPLDMRNNRFLKLNKENKVYECYPNQADFRFYITVFVVGDVELPNKEEQDWDTVELY